MPIPPRIFVLIPHPDLTELDPRAEHSRQVFYQLSEIDAPIRSKIEQDLIPVKCILYVNQLHFQIVFADLFKADFKRLFFFSAYFFPQSCGPGHWQAG